MSIEKDVARIEALEEPARELLKAIKEARPAIGRLDKAKYPGADWVSHQASETTDDQSSGSLVEVVGALEMFRRAAGDPGAFDYLFQVNYLGQTLYEAIEYLTGEDELALMQPRIQAMRQYAAMASQ